MALATLSKGATMQEESYNLKGAFVCSSNVNNRSIPYFPGRYTMS